MSPKSGIVVVTKAVEKICRIITKYGPKLENVISAAVASGLITSAEGATANAFLTAATAACTIFKVISGY